MDAKLQCYTFVNISAILIRLINILWKMCFSHTLSSSEAPYDDPRCNLPLDPGPCQNYTVHWYYDRKANSCAQFWYGGCGGNDNRYKSDDQCAKACVLYRTGNSWFWKVNVHIIWTHLNIILFFSPNMIRNHQKVNSVLLN